MGVTFPVDVCEVIQNGGGVRIISIQTGNSKICIVVRCKDQIRLVGVGVLPHGHVATLMPQRMEIALERIGASNMLACCHSNGCKTTGINGPTSKGCHRSTCDLPIICIV